MTLVLFPLIRKHTLKDRSGDEDSTAHILIPTTIYVCETWKTSARIVKLLHVPSRTLWLTSVCALEVLFYVNPHIDCLRLPSINPPHGRRKPGCPQRTFITRWSKKGFYRLTFSFTSQLRSALKLECSPLRFLYPWMDSDFLLPW